METKVLEAIERFSLLENGKTVTVALSGGADSMALLYSLLSLKEKLGIKVNAAHLNHLIRGEEALRDEEFVKRKCKELGVELFCEKADIPAIAKAEGLSTELAARKVRYEFLERVAKGVIATAHTASDNLETVLFNIARGTALDGLCGIPAKRGKIIRPLLLCCRADVEEYCEKNGIDYVTDSTNLEDCYTRNKIRHNAVPVMKEINPSVENAVLRMATSLKEDADFLDSEAGKYRQKFTDSYGELAVNELKVLHKSLQTRIIRDYIKNVKPQAELEKIHIEAVIALMNNGGKTNLPPKLIAEVKNGKLSVFEKKVSQKKEFEVEINQTDYGFLKNTQKINNLLLNNSLDCDRIKGKLVVRTRIAGDSIRLRNRGCTKTLNRIFSENKLDIDLRDSVPVISDDGGVVWVYGLGVAQRCAVTEKSKSIYVIKVREEKGS